MNRFSFVWVGVCFSLLFAATAIAQSSPTPEETLRAWLASPHANGQTEAFRHWDTEREIPGSCAVCHSTVGVVDYLKNYECCWKD